jgi:hypothetical protein
MKASKEHRGHGGARAGAGRPKLGKVSMLIWLPPELKEHLIRTAKKVGISRSELSEILLKDVFKF